MVKAVIFDIGGVLAHDVWERLLLDKERGIASIYDLDSDEVQTVGQDLWEEFAYRTTADGQDWAELEREYWNLFVERLHISVSPEEFIQLTDRFIQPVIGMQGLIEGLQAKRIKLVICSDNTEFWIHRQMNKLDLHRYFDSNRVITSCRVGVSKSEAGFEMFQAAVSAIGVDKGSCVFVDDREKNIRHALRFGLAGIIFPSHAEYGAQYLETLLRNMNAI